MKLPRLSSVASEQGTCPSIAGKIGVDVGHLVTVELVQSCISKMALGKACDPDELSAEHLAYTLILVWLFLYVSFLGYNYCI